MATTSISQHLHHPKMAFIDVGPGQTMVSAEDHGTFHVHGIPAATQPTPFVPSSYWANLELTINHPSAFTIDLGYNSSAWIEGMGPDSYSYDNTSHQLKLWAGKEVIDQLTVTGRPFVVLSHMPIEPGGRCGTYLATGFVGMSEGARYAIPVHSA